MVLLAVLRNDAVEGHGNRSPGTAGGDRRLDDLGFSLDGNTGHRRKHLLRDGSARIVPGLPQLSLPRLRLGLHTSVIFHTTRVDQSDKEFGERPLLVGRSIHHQ